MVNEVNNSNVDSVVRSLSNNQRTESNQLNSSATSAGSSNATNASSEVTLTNTAETLQALEAEIQAQPVVDTQRVQEVRQSILDGTFNINNERTAENLLDFENLLGNQSNQGS